MQMCSFEHFLNSTEGCDQHTDKPSVAIVSVDHCLQCWQYGPVGFYVISVVKVFKFLLMVGCGRFWPKNVDFGFDSIVLMTTLHNHFMALWTISGTTRVSQY